MRKHQQTYGVTERSGRWVARPYVPRRGKVYAGTWDTREEATKAALAKIDEERRLPATKETVATFAARWVQDFPRPKESTNDRYRADAQRFAKEFGDRKLHELTPRDVRSYALRRRNDIGALRAMLSDAKRDGLALSNPFSELRIPKGRGRKDIVVVTAEELDALADLALKAHGRHFGPVFKSMVLFAANTGLRPGEIAGLEWPDIDFENETIHVRRQLHKGRVQLPKSGVTRTAYLPPPAAQALRDLPLRLPRPVCDVTGGEMVFLGKERQRIRQSSLSQYWKPVRTAFEANLDPVRLREFQEGAGEGKPAVEFYSLRHWAATFLMEQGVESWIVAKQLGHQDGGRLAERLYGHPRDAVARERLREVFRQAEGPAAPLPDRTVADSNGGRRHLAPVQ